MAKDKVYLSSRHWLNPNDSADSGAISIYVSSEREVAWVSADVSIWDCNKKIRLDFSVSNKEEAAQRAKKLDIMITDLIKLRFALGKAYSDMLKVKEINDG